MPAQVLQSLQNLGLKLAIAESLTGGALASDLIAIPGASNTVLGSVVAYQTALKQGILGVSKRLLSERGAVDPDVALEMAEGVRRLMAKNCRLPASSVVGVATTGVAGPDPQDGKPVGEVHIAISADDLSATYAFHFSGSRSEIRAQAVLAAVNALREHFVNS
jgi:nicotinamide-nucleotide amidase